MAGSGFIKRPHAFCHMLTLTKLLQMYKNMQDAKQTAVPTLLLNDLHDRARGEEMSLASPCRDKTG